MLLTLPHVMVPCLCRGASPPPESVTPNATDRMMKEQGRFQVPFLRDPNTGAERESAAIVATSTTMRTE